MCMVDGFLQQTIGTLFVIVANTFVLRPCLLVMFFLIRSSFTGRNTGADSRIRQDHKGSAGNQAAHGTPCIIMQIMRGDQQDQLCYGLQRIE